MKLSDMIESKYLKQADVDGEVVVTVQSITKVNVARDDEDADYKWTIKFHEFAKPMVANPTNLKRLAKYLGDDSDDWIGNSVVVFVDPDIEFGGKVTGGLRIKGVKHPASGAKKPSGEDDVNRKLRDAADDAPF